MKHTALIATSIFLAATTAQAIPQAPIHSAAAPAGLRAPIAPTSYLDNLSWCVERVSAFARRSGPLEPFLIDAGILGCAANSFSRRN